MDDTVDEMISDSGAAWLLATTKAFQEAQQMLRHNARSPGRMDADALRAAVTRLDEVFARGAEEAMSDYLERFEPDEAIRARLASTPREIEFDAEINRPIIRWQRASSAANGRWTGHTVAVPGTTIDVRTPFRPVALDRLPPGTRLVHIDDPHHTASASMSEVLRTIEADLESAAHNATPAEFISRCRRLVDLYRNAVQLGFDSLATDEIRPLTFELQGPIGLERAPETIANLAVSGRAHRALAIHLGAELLRQLLDRDEAAGTARAAELITAARVGQDERLERINRAALRRNRVSMPRAKVQVILRPSPDGPPVMAVIPAGRRGSVLPFPMSP